MPPIDPNRILNLAKTLESGTTDEKLGMIAHLDPEDPIASGVLIRALTDESGAVRLRALQRLEDADVRPPDAVLDDLLEDEDDAIRSLAEKLSDRPDTLNPLEKLVPLVEQVADSLGPLGGMLRNMIQTLRVINQPLKLIPWRSSLTWWTRTLTAASGVDPRKPDQGELQD